MDPMTHRVYCFGEILWDVLPDGPQPGGAPLNVAYHLTKLRLTAGLISCVGSDGEGRHLTELVDAWMINKDHVQVDDEHPTGKVIAKMSAEHEVAYEIIAPVAWDFISTNSMVMRTVKNADCLVYGSLASRNFHSRQSLFALLEVANLKVFDVNLRPPFYESSVLEALLEKADLLKMNSTELEIIREMLGIRKVDEQSQVDIIRKKFGIQEVLITRGEKGASYYIADRAYHAKGIPITVNDTIGSGDAFLAAFLACRFRKKSPETILKKAVAMGSFIAGKKGGCPAYPLSAYMDFVEKHAEN